MLHAFIANCPHHLKCTMLAKCQSELFT